MNTLIRKLIMLYLQHDMNNMRKRNNNNNDNNKTPYIYYKGTGKDYPKYLMYTDTEGIRNRMHDIL